jgi:niacin transporter
MTALTAKTAEAKRNLFTVAAAALFLALGVLLPQLFHAALGQAGGRLLLPMHISVLLAGLCLGWHVGAFVGVLTPMLSFLLTGMPPVPTLFLMMGELAVYGAACGLLRCKVKLPLYAALPVALLGGRLTYAGLLFLMVDTLHLLPVGIQGAASVWSALVVGWPGVVLQIAVVPLYAKELEKLRGKLGV